MKNNHKKVVVVVVVVKLRGQEGNSNWHTSR
jgi:hypothetical protein